MPVSCTELYRSDSRGGRSDNAKSDRTRVFRVVTAIDAAIIDGLTGTPDPLPQIGEDYPGGSQGGILFPLRCDNYDVRPFGDAISALVLCHYSNDRSGRIRPVADVTRPGYQAFGVDIQKTTQDIPTVLVFPQPVPGANVPEAETPDAEPKIYKVSMTYGVYEVTVPLASMTTAVVDSIRAQTDHIHAFGQHYYRFEPGRIVHVEPSVWLATYTWIGDDGLEDLTGMNFVQNSPDPETGQFLEVDPAQPLRKWIFPRQSPNLLPLQNPTDPPRPPMIRSPFHVLTYVLKRNMEPRFKQVCTFKFDYNGWRSLPGNLNL